MSYATAYLGTKPFIRFANGSAGVWVRPTDWPALPVLGAGENKFVGLYGVDDTDGNFVSILTAVSTGTWTVDWGDGVVETGLTSNTKRDHLYNFSTIGSTPTAIGGWKPVTVTVTTSGGDITTFSLQQKHSQAGLPGGAFRVNWLDIAINGPSMTALTFGGSTVIFDKLRKATIGIHADTSMNEMFRGFTALQSVPLFNTALVTTMQDMFRDCTTIPTVPLFNTTSVVNMNSMFNNCTDLQTIPLINTTNVLNMQGMFQSCSSLQYIPLLSTGAVTNMSSMFNNCTNLMTLPLLNTQSVTNMQAMFQGCFSIQSMPLLNTQSVTNMDSMFNNNISLQFVPLFNTVSVTNMTNMFNNCGAIITIPLFNTAAVTSISNFLYQCYSIQSVPPLNTAAVSSAANSSQMFLSCRSLSRGRTNGIRFAVNYSGCKLSAAQINDIFAGLGTASGAQTVTVSGNYGYATCTPSIATAKGWTVA